MAKSSRPFQNRAARRVEYGRSLAHLVQRAKLHLSTPSSKMLASQSLAWIMYWEFLGLIQTLRLSLCGTRRVRKDWPHR